MIKSELNANEKDISLASFCIPILLTCIIEQG